jgi:hypothetical protein
MTAYIAVYKRAKLLRGFGLSGRLAFYPVPFLFDRAFWVFVEALRKGPDFTLYCGRQYDNPSPVPAVGLATEHPSPQGLLADGKAHIRFDSI